MREEWRNYNNTGLRQDWKGDKQGNSVTTDKGKTGKRRGNCQGLTHFNSPYARPRADVENALRALADGRQVKLVVREQLQHVMRHVETVVFGLRDMLMRKLGLIARPPKGCRI
jgi:hypothetical protein